MYVKKTDLNIISRKNPSGDSKIEHSYPQFKRERESECVCVCGLKHFAWIRNRFFRKETLFVVILKMLAVQKLKKTFRNRANMVPINRDKGAFNCNQGQKDRESY